MKLEIRGLAKRIKGEYVLRDVSLECSSGEIVGLQGVNGSGKTVLMRCMCGFVRPNEGSVLVDGCTVGRDIEFPPHLGSLIEGPSMLDGYTGLDNLRLLASIRRSVDERAVKDVMKCVGLDPDLKKKYRAYSLGMKQRLGIAAAIMERPDLLVLDEPTNALDESGLQMVVDVLRRERNRGVAIVIASHDAQTLRFLADRVYRMSAGSIVGVDYAEG